MSKKKDYKVGYGKPPVEHQIKPGERRNPKGRPKGSLNLVTRLQRAARAKVTVVINGRRATIDKIDAALTQLMNQAAGGNLRAIEISITKLELADRLDVSATPIDAAARAKADAEILKALKGRLLGGKENDHDEEE
jgi:hypothetical protein